MCSDVTHVIHFDLPGEAENYTHRSGRTGRAGRAGISLSIIGVRDVNKVRQLERALKTHFTYVRVPGGAEIGKQQVVAYMKKLKSVEVDHEGLSELLSEARAELDAFSKEELIDRFMSMAFNRIIEQHRTSYDLNVDMSRKDHSARAERPTSLERFSTGRQMFINLGTADGFDKGKMLGYICGISGVSGEIIGTHADQGRVFLRRHRAGPLRAGEELLQQRQLQRPQRACGRSRRRWQERSPLRWTAAVATRAADGGGYKGGGGGGYKGGGGGGYKGGGGGGYQGGGDRPQATAAIVPRGGGYRGNDDRGGYPEEGRFLRAQAEVPEEGTQVSAARRDHAGHFTDTTTSLRRPTSCHGGL